MCVNRAVPHLPVCNIDAMVVIKRPNLRDNFFQYQSYHHTIVLGFCSYIQVFVSFLLYMYIIGGFSNVVKNLYHTNIIKFVSVRLQRFS